MLIYIIRKDLPKMTKQVKITSEFIRLGQLLKLADYIQTGGEAAGFIAGANIEVDDQITWSRGKKIYPGSKVRIGDDVLEICK